MGLTALLMQSRLVPACPRALDIKPLIAGAAQLDGGVWQLDLAFTEVPSLL